MSDVKSGKKKNRCETSFTASVWRNALAYACCRVEQCTHGCDSCVYYFFLKRIAVFILDVRRSAWHFKMISAQIFQSPLAGTLGCCHCLRDEKGCRNGSEIFFFWSLWTNYIPKTYSSDQKKVRREDSPYIRFCT